MDREIRAAIWSDTGTIPECPLLGLLMSAATAVHAHTRTCTTIVRNCHTVHVIQHCLYCSNNAHACNATLLRQHHVGKNSAPNKITTTVHTGHSHGHCMLQLCIRVLRSGCVPLMLGRTTGCVLAGKMHSNSAHTKTVCNNACTLQPCVCTGKQHRNKIDPRLMLLQLRLVHRKMPIGSALAGKHAAMNVQQHQCSAKRSTTIYPKAGQLLLHRRIQRTGAPSQI